MFVIIFGKKQNNQFNINLNEKEINNIINLFKKKFNINIQTKQYKVFQKDKLKYIIDTGGKNQLLEEEIKNLNLGENFISFEKLIKYLPIYTFENYYNFDNIEIIESNILYNENFKLILSFINNGTFNSTELKIEFKNFNREHEQILNELGINLENKKEIYNKIEYFII